ncbi:hypothetical protein R3P38DRAFT_3197898 [Favolaschia claudopus]|uniref:Uncharacterized protein n=1 Tax=Favolaschia claudopus TaxID=2862362 RepID=A0AAW0B2Q4_9AGAR
MPPTTTTPAKTTSNVDTNNPPSRHNTLVHLCLAPPRRLLALSTASSTPPTPMRTYIYAHLLPISRTYPPPPLVLDCPNAADIVVPTHSAASPPSRQFLHRARCRNQRRRPAASTPSRLKTLFRCCKSKPSEFLRFRQPDDRYCPAPANDSTPISDYRPVSPMPAYLRSHLPDIALNTRTPPRGRHTPPAPHSLQRVHTICNERLCPPFLPLPRRSARPDANYPWMQYLPALPPARRRCQHAQAARCLPHSARPAALMQISALALNTEYACASFWRFRY